MARAHLQEQEKGQELELALVCSDGPHQYPHHGSSGDHDAHPGPLHPRSARGEEHQG